MLALEMGGNNPIVVWDTADIRTAAILVVQSAFLSAGQRCSNARRLIVRDTLADRLIEEVCDLANRLIVDHPHADPAPYMGPVIDNEAADGLTERSEEHTSELQSLMRISYAVFCLKKKKAPVPKTKIIPD